MWSGIHTNQKKRNGGGKKPQQTTQETFFFRISQPNQATVVTTAEMAAVSMKAGMGEGSDTYFNFKNKQQIPLKH